MTEQTMSWEEIEEGFRDALDCDGVVKIGGLSYLPSVVLERTDPVAYRIGLNEYADILAEDYIIEGVND